MAALPARRAEAALSRRQRGANARRSRAAPPRRPRPDRCAPATAPAQRAGGGDGGCGAQPQDRPLRRIAFCRPPSRRTALAVLPSGASPFRPLPSSAGRFRAFPAAARSAVVRRRRRPHCRPNRLLPRRRDSAAGAAVAGAGGADAARPRRYLRGRSRRRSYPRCRLPAACRPRRRRRPLRSAPVRFRVSPRCRAARAVRRSGRERAGRGWFRSNSRRVLSLHAARRPLLPCWLLLRRAGGAAVSPTLSPARNQGKRGRSAPAAAG